jgi:hypothetical protein
MEDRSFYADWIDSSTVCVRLAIRPGRRNKSVPLK